MRKTVFVVGLVLLMLATASVAEASCRSARTSYTSGKISSAEYKNICHKEKEIYREKLKTVKLDYKNNRITRDEYEHRSEAIKKEYKTNE